MSHPAFETLRTMHVPSLNLTLNEYRHTATGASHFHLDADDQNNAFLVAFLTVPRDSTGVAHILEHTSLCGSERYPVRDPFFMMIRRSLNTFMNAFTASDWTAYPFASQNPKDFDNLLQVYLDAAFFPRLEELDFKQEGHRIEFSEPGNPQSDLVYKGVVFNEMKGAMSSPVSQVWQALKSNVFPTITYHYNSGGDPAAIPDLTYEQLRDFHRQHYHPSNAVFMTYGNMPVIDHQTRMHDLALARFDRQTLDFSVPDEQRRTAPISVQDSYTLEGEEDTTGKTHVVLAWLLGNSAVLDELMPAMLLSGVLLEHGASPLRHVLETSDLGSAPSELCGLDDSPREAMFACGLEGSDADKADAVQQQILDTLEAVARDGVPLEQVEAVLHQLELSQREVGGDGFPYGLQLMIRALSPHLHGADPAQFLNLDPVLAQMRERIRDPQYIPSLVRELLLDNPHRVRLCMAPDKDKAKHLLAAEAERLASIKTGLTAADEQRIVERAQALKARQEEDDDPEILPKVGLEDVPEDMRIPTGVQGTLGGYAAHWYSRGTNGLVYHDLVVDMPALDAELLNDMSLFGDCVTEVGVAGDDYLATQARQAMVSGGVNARVSLRGHLDDPQRTSSVFVMSSKALARNGEQMARLLLDTFLTPRFDEHARLRELVAQARAHAESRVTDHGHVLAMHAAAAGLAPIGDIHHQWDGLAGIKRLKALDDSLDDAANLTDFAARLEAIGDTLRGAPRRLLAIADPEHLDEFNRQLETVWRAAASAEKSTDGFAPAPVSRRIAQAWVTNTQVNFCARAYPTVAQSHADAPALTVLGGVLRNGFLHRAIREQGGAYGAGASYSPDTGGFRFFSYRDPRLAETLVDFDKSIDWLLNDELPDRLLEEAILGVIGSIDRPGSPAGEAMTAYFSTLHGRTPDIRRALRARFLAVTMADIKRVAETYLVAENASTAVLTSTSVLDSEADLGLDVVNL